MSVRIPISNRARTYGYVIWPKKLEHDMRGVLPDEESVHVVFNCEDLGRRRIDWKYCRISVGPSHTRCLSDGVSTFELSSPRRGLLQVDCV